MDKASQLPTGYTTPYLSAVLPTTAPTTNNTNPCSYGTGAECTGNYGTWKSHAAAVKHQLRERDLWLQRRLLPERR